MPRKRSDIVLSMTLAETFLLLLFLIWLSDVARNAGEQRPTDPSLLRIENARLTTENERLQSDVGTLTGEVQRLQLIVDAFRKAVGIPETVTTSEQVPGAVKTAQEAARRGAPKCAPENLFARVTIRDGSTTLRVVAPTAVAELVAEETGVSLSPGAALTSAAEIESALWAVSAYAGSNSCRFDYTLAYKSKADYYDGRERFERGQLFYAAGISADAKRRR